MLLFLGCTLLAFSEGINFEKGTFKEALAKAKKENKMLYIDVYTTWCGPCKIFAKKFFNNNEIGSYFNQHFICFSVDAEKGEGLEIARTYKVSGYPTNLFIHPDESLVYTFSGCPESNEELLQKGEIARAEFDDPMKLSTYESQFASNNYNEQFLRNYLEKLNRRNENTDKLTNAFISKYATSLGKDSTVNYLMHLNESMNTNLVYYMKGASCFTRGEQTYEENLEDRMYHDITIAVQHNQPEYFQTAWNRYKELLPENKEKHLLFNYFYHQKLNNPELGWESTIEYCDFISAKSKLDYVKEDSISLQENIKNLSWQLAMSGVPKEQLDEMIEKNVKAQIQLRNTVTILAFTTLNTAAWEVFDKKRKDTNMLQKGIQWAEKAVELAQISPSAAHAIQDTYACLLYAIGRKQEAVMVEETILKQHAASLSSEDKQTYEETLKKMKANAL